MLQQRSADVWVLVAWHKDHSVIKLCALHSSLVCSIIDRRQGESLHISWLTLMNMHNGMKHDVMATTARQAKARLQSN